MNIDEEVFVEIKNRKVFRFNIDSQITKGANGANISLLGKKNFILFYITLSFFLAFVENITPNDIDKELKRTLLTQREKFFKKA